MNSTFPMLIRREIWEHKSLWIAPLVWVGLITLFFNWAMLHVPDGGNSGIKIDGRPVGELSLDNQQKQQVQQALNMPEERKESVFAVSYLAIFGLISVFMTIVVFFYLIDCLYTERKDRSILFWKSLPVSDTNVVLSKLAVALLVVPIGVILLSAVTQFVNYLTASAILHDTVIGQMFPDWSFSAWLRSQAIAFGVMLGGVLWYAPIAGYLLLLSSWAKNKVFLWAILPPIALPVLEKVFLQSDHVLDFLGRRFTGYIELMKVDPNAFEAGTNDRLPAVDDVYNAFHLSNMFTSVEMWLGVAAGAAMVFVAIRIRRYRDES
ncbi:MAG: ABC-2 transporter permease [Pseudomonadota bacterium]